MQKCEGERPLERLGVGGWIIVKWNLKIGWEGTELSGSGYKYVAGFCEHGIEHSDSIKCGNLLSSQETKLFKKYSAT
jgi:hypothetical protein